MATEPIFLAKRVTSEADQRHFAQLSGDFNCIHLDPIAARRTLAGACVVHGINTLLWLLESVLGANPDLPPICGVKSQFRSMIYVGHSVEAVVAKRTASSLRVDAICGNKEAMRVTITFGEPITARHLVGNSSLEVKQIPPREEEHSWEELIAASGSFRFNQSPSIETTYPNLVGKIGKTRVAAIAATSCLVGMIAPGLHSLFGGLSFQIIDDSDPISSQNLTYQVSDSDERFKLLHISVEGGGIEGMVDCFQRPAPVSQPLIRALAQHVQRDEFQNSCALIIGGSRGLGELTAKFLAAGGAHVTITYASGRADAERVAQDIKNWGGSCDFIALNIAGDVKEQLSILSQKTTHLYYFATPKISARRQYSEAQFLEYYHYYVTAFYSVVLAISGGPLTIFNPSSVFVESRPYGMTEYAMAKAASEVMVSDLPQLIPGVKVIQHRLPRLPTDQTAEIQTSALDDPIKVILKIIKEMHSS